MKNDAAQELLDVVFVVYLTEGSLLDEDESPVVGVRQDLEGALKLAFERVLRDATGAVDFTVEAVGPLPDGRVNWIVDTPVGSVIVEAVTLHGAPLSDDLAAWLMDPARIHPSQA